MAPCTRKLERAAINALELVAKRTSGLLRSRSIGHGNGDRVAISGGRWRWLIVARPQRLLHERRAHELDRVLARPFGRARDGADLAALRIEEDRGRHTNGAADELEVLKHLGA